MRGIAVPTIMLSSMASNIASIRPGSTTRRLLRWATPVSTSVTVTVPHSVAYLPYGKLLACRPSSDIEVNGDRGHSREDPSGRAGAVHGARVREHVAPRDSRAPRRDQGRPLLPLQEQGGDRRRLLRRPGRGDR